jgi:sortase A
MRAKRVSIVVAALAFLVGAALICYPYLSDYVHKQAQAKVAQSQATVVSQTPEEDLSAERAAALDYNARLLSSRSLITDPFDSSAARVSSDEYESLMNLAGDGVMGTIVIPRIDVSTPIYHGTSDEVLGEGVGHLEETSLPYGGVSSHCVLAGHNGLPSVKIFDRIDELEEGDYFILQVLGEDHAYRVTSTETVLPEETSSLVIEEGRDLVTLVTCVPYGINTHRLLVHAERSDVPDEWAERAAQGGTVSANTTSLTDTPLLPFTIIGLAVALGLLVAWRVARRRAQAARRGDSDSDADAGGRHFADAVSGKTQETGSAPGFVSEAERLRAGGGRSGARGRDDAKRGRRGR